MKVIQDMWEAFKIPIIILTVLGLFFVTTSKIIPFINEKRYGKSPVVSIEAENQKVYSKSTKIKESDFKVYAVHENGKKTKVDSDDYKLSTSKPRSIGKYTPVTITLNSDQSVSVKTKVKNKRDAVVKFNCGTPKLKDVKAVLYSNGELCFEGKGDVLSFNNYPWLEYDGDVEITAVTFKKEVQPKIMDNWFTGLATLESVGKIPASVVSMVETFNGCESLLRGADWSACSNLNNVTGLYKGCSSLTKVPSLTPSIVVADEMCSGCSVLESCPDMSQANSLESTNSMMEECTAISNANVGPLVVTMDRMFSGCINLNKMPAIPDSVTTMANAFENCSSMTTLTSIPVNAKNINNCFTGCKMIEGDLPINGTPENYSGCFQGAAIATKVNLIGVYATVNTIAYESDNRNILVNGKVAINPDSLLREN